MHLPLVGNKPAPSIATLRDMVVLRLRGGEGDALSFFFLSGKPIRTNFSETNSSAQKSPIRVKTQNREKEKEQEKVSRQKQQILYIIYYSAFLMRRRQACMLITQKRTERGPCGTSSAYVFLLFSSENRKMAKWPPARRNLGKLNSDTIPSRLVHINDNIIINTHPK